KRPSRSSAAAKATEWTSRSSPPSNASPTSEKTRATSSSERTSHSVTRGLPTEPASSRTPLSIRSPWNVNASSAPSSASLGTIAIPAVPADGRVRVIVRLAEAPLAAAPWRSLQAAGATQRLDLRTRFARSYLAHLARVQNAAAGALRRAIPEARVQERFQIV